MTPDRLQPILDAGLRRLTGLRSTQPGDGPALSFVDSPGVAGPATTAAVLVARHHLGLDWRPEDHLCAAGIVRRQRHDGSFAASPFSTRGQLGATIVCAAALSRFDHPDARAALARGIDWIEARSTLGDVVRSVLGDPFTSGLYAVLGGIAPADALPTVPTLLPAIGPIRKLLERRINLGALVGMVQYGVITRRLQGGRAGSLVGRAELDFCTSFQNPNGSWNDAVHQTLMGLLSVHAFGVPVDDPRIDRALRWLDGNRHETEVENGETVVAYAEFASPVWTTAMALQTELTAGTDPNDTATVAQACYLAAANRDTRQLAEDNPDRPDHLTGGWAFQADNPYLPDTDDSGIALATLGRVHRRMAATDPAAATIAASIERGIAWIVAMQDASGGFASYTRGMPSKPRGPLYTDPVNFASLTAEEIVRILVDPPAELGDSATAGVTGRVLFGLGKCGLQVGNPTVDAALDFLRGQQLDNGAWWGRWLCNYAAATAWVIRGAVAVGESAGSSWLASAAEFLRSHQNDDGGWGETPESYRTPLLAARGPSMPGLTGVVLVGLMEIEPRPEQAIRRGIDYLVRTHDPQRGWPNNGWVHTFIPPDLFYWLPIGEVIHPLEAVGAYAAREAQDDAPTEATVPPASVRTADGSWSAERLQAWRRIGDPTGDRLVAEAFATPDRFDQLNTIFGHLIANDDEPPPRVPAPLADYFDGPTLPAWFDPDKAAIAQRAFADHGWSIAAVLFCSALPQAYAARNGAEVLMQTQGLSKNTRRRILETAQFLFDVMEPGAFRPRGRGIRAIQKVRLMHAAIRHLIRAKGWDEARYGTPINQMDLAGTTLTFSTVTTDGLQRMGFDLHADVVDAYLHVWKAIAHGLGLDEAFLPRDDADAHALRTTIWDDQWGASEAGNTLAHQLVETMHSYYPGPGSREFPIALIRELAGDTCADLLGLPHVTIADDVLEAVFAASGLVHRLLGDAPTGDWRHAFALRLLEGFVLVQREGKQTKFRIPATLRRAWKLSD